MPQALVGEESPGWVSSETIYYMTDSDFNKLKGSVRSGLTDDERQLVRFIRLVDGGVAVTVNSKHAADLPRKVQGLWNSALITHGLMYT